MEHTDTIKQIFTENGAWWVFQQKHDLREAIPLAVVKLLSCKNIVPGFYLYKCSNKKCTHIKPVFFTCKSKACSSCGKMAATIWFHKQKNILSNTKWQHITFTILMYFGIFAKLLDTCLILLVN